MTIPRWMRREVISRALNRCEYCQISQTGQEAVFHIDHIHPVKLGGETALDNLALACVSCSLHKGSRITGTDPKTGKTSSIFHPREQSWKLHFRWKRSVTEGITPAGRATVALLKMNRPVIVLIREEETRIGRHPPP